MAYKAKVSKAKSKTDFDEGIFQDAEEKTYGIKDAFKALSKFGGKIEVNNGNKFIGIFTISYKKSDNTEVETRFKKWLNI